MRIYHVATLADWQRAKTLGTYTTSTYGASLDDVGYIHAARAEQVVGVVAAHYADVDEPILLLEIDTDLLDVPWREDPVDGDTFPHVYGPLNTGAVVGFHYAYATPKETVAVRRRPPDPLVTGFYGLAAVTLSVTVALLVTAIVASERAGGSPRPTAAPTVLWSLTLASLVATLMACVVALVLDRRPTTR